MQQATSGSRAGVAAGAPPSAASEDDAESQSLWRSVRGKVLARRGEEAKALELARQGVEILRGTDALVWQADALVDLADVLLVLGHEAEAREAIDEAASLYQRQGSALPAPP